MQRKFQAFKLSVKFQDRRLSSTICFGYYELNKKKSAFVKARNNTFVFVFLPLASLMHADVPSSASVYKSFDHVFIVRVLSPSGAARYQGNSIFVWERSPRRFAVWLDEVRSPPFVPLKSGALRMHLTPYDGFDGRGPEMQHRVNAMKTISRYSHIRHVRRIILGRSLITIGNHDMTFGYIAVFECGRSIIITARIKPPRFARDRRVKVRGPRSLSRTVAIGINTRARHG